MVIRAIRPRTPYLGKKKRSFLPILQDPKLGNREKMPHFEIKHMTIATRIDLVLVQRC